MGDPSFDPRGYAERDLQAQLENWTGGEPGGVFISGSVLLIALIVALILLLIR
jgi:hypothetical protein